MQPSTADNGLSNSAEDFTASRLRASRPASACSSGARSRSCSRPTTPKWVPVTLEQKLQHYRDDPRALEQLNRRVKEYSRPSSPRKTPTGATAASVPVAPWAISAQRQSSSRPSSAPASPQSCTNPCPQNPAHASTEHGHCPKGEQGHTSARAPPACSPVPLSPVHLEHPSTAMQQQTQHQHEAAGPAQLQGTQQDLQQQPQPCSEPQHPDQGTKLDASQAQSTCVSTTTASTLQDSNSFHNPCRHSVSGRVPIQLQEAPSTAQVSAAGPSSTLAHIVQDCSQDSHQPGSGHCDAALQLQQLLEQHEQEGRYKPFWPAVDQQQQHAQDDIWHQIEQARLNEQASIIQRAWRSMRFVKAARLQLLCHAMLRLEHQIIRSNESSARAAARAEARAQVYAAEAAAAAAAAGAVAPGRGGLSSLQGGSISAAAATAAAAIVAAEEGPVAAAVAAAVAEYLDVDQRPTAAAAVTAAEHHTSGHPHLSHLHRHEHNHPRHSAPPTAAAAGHIMHPGRVGGPLVLPGDFFETIVEAGGSPKAAKLASARSVPAPGAAPAAATAAAEPAVATTLAAAGSGKLRSAVRPKSASVAVGTPATVTLASSTATASSSSSRPQSAVWPASPNLATAAASSSTNSTRSSSRPQAAYACPHSAYARPQSALVRPQSARPSSGRPASAFARPSTAAAAAGTGAASGGHSNGSSGSNAAVSSRLSAHPPAQHQLGRGRAGSSRPASAAAAAGVHAGSSRSSRAANPSLPPPPPPAAAAATIPTAAAAALPEGPMPSRGVQITGQLTPISGGPDSEGNMAAFADAAAAFAAAAAEVGLDSGWVQALTTSSGSGCQSMEQQQQQQQGKGRQKLGGLGAAVSGGVVWNEEESVVDLEIEAQLKTLTEVLPSDVRQQVAQEQLLRARKQLLQAWELHAARMASYRSQLAAEAVLHQTLTVAGDSVDLTSKLEPLPPPPCMRIIPGKQELKELVAAAMDLHHEKLFMAACADSDTLNPQPRKPSSSSSSSHGGNSSRANSVSGGKGLSMSGGRFNM